MLIRSAEVWRRGLCDVRIEGGRVAELGRLTAKPGEQVIDAHGGALLPGLHDHHIHLAALAAKRASIACGPPEVSDEAALAEALQQPGTGWLRGIGYHESIAGMLDAATLDRLAPDRPVRIQHRSGRMWFLNSAAMNALLQAFAAPPGLDRATGRLFDEDGWLRAALGSSPPDLAEVSTELTAYGVTGLTDMTPSNGSQIAAHLEAQRQCGHLTQRVVLAGLLALADEELAPGIRLGPAKLHLHEADLPNINEAVRFVAAAHAQGRGVAVHCTTEVELVFALAAIAQAGPYAGDRIEHAGIAPDHLVEQISVLGLAVVSQPHFIAERGDQYACDVDPRDLSSLYRLRAFTRAGVTLAAGSDAPFGNADPWAAMAAAVSRTTRGGLVLGPEEALEPEEALALFLADPLDLTRERVIAPGVEADLCLLDRPWQSARDRLSADDVRLTLIDGQVVHDRVDQAPVERRDRVEAAA